MRWEKLGFLLCGRHFWPQETGAGNRLFSPEIVLSVRGLLCLQVEPALSRSLGWDWPHYSVLQINQIRISGSGTQASVFLKAPEAVPMCGKRCGPRELTEESGCWCRVLLICTTPSLLSLPFRCWRRQFLHFYWNLKSIFFPPYKKLDINNHHLSSSC